jgi:pimeloyl-ACP methyl ester carboxylesterase
MASVLAPLTGPSRVEAGVRASFGPNAATMPRDFVARRAPIWLRPTVSAALSEERVTLEDALESLSTRYGEIRAPLAIVCGAQDGRNPEDARRLAAAVPGSRLVMLPDTGHYVQYARPDALIEVIQEAAAAGRPESS